MKKFIILILTLTFILSTAALHKGSDEPNIAEQVYEEADLSRRDIITLIASTQGEGLILQGVNLMEVDLSILYLPNTNLRLANLVLTSLEGANLKDSILINANLYGTSMGGTNLQNADLENVNLKHADIIDTDFSSANLKGADLQNSFVTLSNLQNTNLENTNLENVDFRWSYLRNADLTNATFNTETRLPDETNWTTDTDMGRFTDPNHPDFWEPDWVEELLG